jgi:hypothetical protein
MSEIVPLNARSLSFKRAGQRCTLEFDSEYLTHSFQDKPAFYISKTPLWRIMPELLVDRSIPESAWKHGRISRYSLAAAVVVYFSDIRAYVPLLVPALLLCALYSTYRGVRMVYPPQKTKIVSDWGDEIAVIPHHENIATNRKAFESALMEAVREARNKHES